MGFSVHNSVRDPMITAIVATMIFPLVITKNLSNIFSAFRSAIINAINKILTNYYNIDNRIYYGYLNFNKNESWIVNT